MMYTFKSCFASQIEDFIAQKNALGFGYLESSRLLRDFDRFCLTHFPEENTLTKELCLAWATKKDTEGNNTFRNRMMPVREFARYLNRNGEAAYILPPDIARKDAPYAPYIYTETEILAIWNILDHLTPRVSFPVRHFVIPAMVKLLYCCGLRPAEVRRLRVRDVDLDKGRLNIMVSKQHRSRIVMMADDVTKMLSDCNAVVTSAMPEREPFFPNSEGGFYGKRGLEKTFRLVLKKAGVTGTGRRSPRLYDFRHTFATHRLYHWMNEGKDLNVKNTILSYRQTLNIFVAYMRDEIGIGAAELTFSRVDRDVILNFLTWLEKARGCSVSTRNQRLMALRSFLDFAGQIDCTQTSLYLSACNIPSKEAHGRIVEFLTEPALTALLQQPNPSRQKDQRNLVFMILMYDTAARCSELLDMKVCDLRLDAKHPIAYLHGKGRKTRTVPLLNRTVQHCKQYLNKFHPNKDDYSEAPLFYTVIHGRQQKMSPDTVAAFFAKYGSMAKAVCQEVPEHIHPHMMRHTRAMHLYQSGMPMVLLSQYLGHSQVETTMIYAHADTEMKRAAIQKADAVRGTKPVPDEIWADNEEMILKLSGLL